MSNVSSNTRQTRREIFDYIRRNGPVARSGIAQDLVLSLPTVQKYLDQFTDEGLIVEGGTLPSRGGRAPRAYLANPNGRFAVGVDITHDGVTLVVLNLEREVLFTSRIKTSFERSEAYLAMVGKQVEETVALSGVDRSRVLGVGFGMPGLVSEHTSSVTYGGVIDNLGISSQDFEQYIDYPARVVHDVDAAGLSEFWPQGSFDNAVYLNLSRTLGGSVLINGAIYRGDGDFAGEIGHISLHADGLLCYCGNHGCMDPYCSTNTLSRHTDGSLSVFFEKLAKSDPKMRQIWSDYLKDLARAIHNVRMMFGGTVIIGGELATHVKPFLFEVRRAVDALSFYNPNADDFLVASKYTNEPVATGAALYFVEDFIFSLGDTSGRQRSSLV